MTDADDPRHFPQANMASPEAARLHALAARSQAALGPKAAAIDAQIIEVLAALLMPPNGGRLAAVFATAPSVPVHRHLWRLLVHCERQQGAGVALGISIFAVPLVVVAGIEAAEIAQAVLPCVLDDVSGPAAILRSHHALAGNQAFALANALVASGALDFARLPDLMSWRDRPEGPAGAPAVAPSPIALARGPETVHLRFLLGSALAAPRADLLEDAVGAWGMPLAHALGRQLAAPGTSVLVLPRAPRSLLRALHEGRVAQREAGAHLFASNAIRKLRATVGEPTAVVSAHRVEGAAGGGEIRLSLSSPFDPREAEGFRCPLFPLDRVGDVVAMLTDLLGECRVTDVRVIPGIHADRHADTGLPLLFKGDDVSAAPLAMH
jgi:hypothetical protein